MQDDAGQQPPRRRARILGAAWRAVVVVAVAILLWWIVVPQFAEAGQAWARLGSIPVPLLVLGLVLELASLAAYGALTWTVLDPAERPPYWTVLRIDLASVGVTNSLPGGGATALAVRFHLLGRAGTSYSGAAGSLAVEAIVSNLLMGVLFVAGLLLTVTALPPSPYYLVAGILIAALAAGAVGLALAVRHPERAARLVTRVLGRLPGRVGRRASGFADEAILTMAALGRDRGRFWATVAWGLVNWLLDAAALWVLLLVAGYRGGPGELLVAYALTGIVAFVPITPGGIGVIEGILVPLLVSFGSAHPVAVLGVTAWRIVQYWIPIPLGAVAAFSLLARRRPSSGSRTADPAGSSSGEPTGFSERGVNLHEEP